MQIANVRLAHSQGALVLSGRMVPEQGGAVDLWWRVDGEWDLPAMPGDPFVVGLITSCMWTGEALQVDAPVSRRLLTGLDRAQSVLRSWYDEMSHVQVTVPRGGDRPAGNEPEPTNVACCFTGGVDSWYSLLVHDHEITHLLLVRGFDVPLDDDVQWATALRAAREAARETGKRLVTVSTNLREVADMRRAPWGRQYAGDFWGRVLHGAALAAVGLVLQRNLGALIVPATHTIDSLRPWGSSPMLDHWWSNDTFQVRHEGCAASRLEKVARIARHRPALQTLRVCYSNTGEHNCGRCEKCLRTMTALRLCGALDAAEAFPRRGHLLSALRRLDVPPHLLYHHRALLKEAEHRGDRPLVRALQVLLGERISLERLAARAVRRVRSKRRAIGAAPIGAAAAAGARRP